MHIITYPDDGAPSRNTHITAPQPAYQRSRLHRAALKIADQGKPVFPCRPAPDKSPLTRHGFKDATTDQAKINAFWNANHGASIGMPTGRVSGVFVLDIDRLEALEELGVELPDTTTVRTPRGGMHLYFRHVEGITNSPGGLPKGIDVRGEGGYVLVPPSPGYEVVSKAPIADLPPELLELIRTPSSSHGGGSGRTPRVGDPSPSTEPIPEGSRNRTLFFWALDRKDEGRSHDEVLGLVLTENDARCSPPLERGEVEQIVRSAMRYPVRSGNPSPEVVEACDKLDEDWWARPWKGRGGGGHTDRDVKRVLIELGRRYGQLQPDGSVDVSASVRSVALAAATTFKTVSGSCTKRLKRSGQILKIDASRTHTESATWRLLPPPLQPYNTQQFSPPPMLGVVELRPIDKRVWDLETPAFRPRGHVRKGAGGVLCHVEACGTLSLQEIAARLDISPADLRRRGYMARLVENGLLAEVGEEIYSLPEAYEKKVEEVRRAPYSTIQERRVRRKTDEGRVVCEVVEVGSFASEVERYARQDEKNKEDTENWRIRVRTMARTKENEREITALLNQWSEERGSGFWEAA